MSTSSWSTGTPARIAAAGACAAALLSVVALAGAAHERADLPTAAHALLHATDTASEVTSCLQGARDEIYVPGVPHRLHNRVAVAAAQRRLAGCDIDALVRDVDAVDVPPAAPITTHARRVARADVVNAVALLRRVALDAQAADRMMRASLNGAADGTAVVLAYSSANSGSDAAYRLAEEALALLGDPQSAVDG